ncbi:hypothetical protein ACFXKG_08555 [Streptomyces sp. NPDC059255]|uniref:hypothetical protein n=1 Tax=Streptomyces sp. NPDC059255 TaxID=3346793 RepID=UPI0036AEA6E2
MGNKNQPLLTSTARPPKLKPRAARNCTASKLMSQVGLRVSEALFGTDAAGAVVQ